MAQITLGGNPASTNGELPRVGEAAPDFQLTDADLKEVQLSDYTGKKVVMNIFPSVDTNVCATSVRKFNEQASGREDTVVLNISQDLPFAQKRFCGAEGLENAVTLSGFRHADFQDKYGVRIEDGAFAGLNARAVVVIDENGQVSYTELVPEVGQEPNYEAALSAL